MTDHPDFLDDYMKRNFSTKGYHRLSTYPKNQSIVYFRMNHRVGYELQSIAHSVLWYEKTDQLQPAKASKQSKNFKIDFIISTISK